MVPTTSCPVSMSIYGTVIIHNNLVAMSFSYLLSQND